MVWDKFQMLKLGTHEFLYTLLALSHYRRLLHTARLDVLRRERSRHACHSIRV